MRLLFKQKNLTLRWALTFMVFVLGTGCCANNSTLDHSGGYTYQMVPGKTDSLRWKLVSQNLQPLSCADRETVCKLFGTSIVDQGKTSSVWSYRITANSKGPNTSTNSGDRFSLLQVHFVDNRVYRIEISNIEWELSKAISMQ